MSIMKDKRSQAEKQSKRFGEYRDAILEYKWAKRKQRRRPVHTIAATKWYKRIKTSKWWAIGGNQHQ